MRFHTFNYLRNDGRQRPGEHVSIGFWLHHVPRPLLLCRTLGHRPVVDGTTGFRNQDPGHRWVACDRCGIRPEMQGNLDSTLWDIGQPYTDPFTSQAGADTSRTRAKETLASLSPDEVQDLKGDSIILAPGPWPARADGVLGGQLYLNHKRGHASASVKVGNCGSEHTLAASVQVPGVGALHLHTERIGQWLQRRFNPVGYESRVTEVDLSLEDWSLRWRLWAPRDAYQAHTPRWRDGSLNLDLVERTLGPQRYSYTRHGLPVMGTVRMPDGDDHQVRLTLKRESHGRPGRRPASERWMVQWTSRRGIPYRRHSWKGNETMGASVSVSDESVEHGRWALEACAAIALVIADKRTRYRWRPQPEPEAALEPEATGTCNVRHVGTVAATLDGVDMSTFATHISIPGTDIQHATLAPTVPNEDSGARGATESAPADALPEPPADPVNE